MKRAVILHGTDGNPEINWLPWAKTELEKRGYEAFVPLLPGNHTPDRQVYEAFLRDLDWDFSDNLIIGHSSGATTVLNLLLSDWFPRVNAAVLVGAFLNEKLTKHVDWYEPGQFDGLFPKNGFDTQAIREKAGAVYFIHGDDDPYCDVNDTAEFAEQLGAQVVIIKNGRHLSSNREQLPELIELVDKEVL